MECLEANDEESQVCGLCGVIPEAVLGDGGEDVSCVLESWHLERSETDREGVFPASYSSIISNVFLLRLWCIQEYTWGEDSR